MIPDGINAIPGACVVVIRNGKIAMVKNGKDSKHLHNTYGLPAGTVDFGETYEQAAVREMYEESGLVTTVDKLVKLPTHYEALLKRTDGDKWFEAWSYFCKEFSGELKSSNEGEALWVDINQLDSLELVKNVKNMVIEALQYMKEHGVTESRQIS